jgi:hypothetical protein
MFVILPAIVIIAIIVIALCALVGGIRSKRMELLTWDAMAPEQKDRVLVAEAARRRRKVLLFLFLAAILGGVYLTGTAHDALKKHQTAQAITPPPPTQTAHAVQTLPLPTQPTPVLGIPKSEEEIPIPRPRPANIK